MLGLRFEIIVVGVQAIEQIGNINLLIKAPMPICNNDAVRMNSSRVLGRNRTMNNNLILGLVLLSISIASFPAHTQEVPSFDCSKAKTHVENILCSGGNSGMGWIDRTMADLYKAVREAPGADTTALESSQYAWLAKRNDCKGSDVKVMNCLTDSYRARYLELSSSYDEEHVTGRYGNDRGVLDAVLFPDGSLSVNISTSGPAPAYDSCSVTFRAALEGNAVRHVFSSEELGVDGQCTVDMKVTSTQIDIPKDCRTLCGSGASFDGTYKKR